MKICVCGWYFTDDWYMSLYRINDKYPVHIVCNRYDDRLPEWGLSYTERENTGLEFGAYNHYLMRIWDGGDVLFCHDDLGLEPMLTSDMEVVDGELAFDRIAERDAGDQAYIFPNRKWDVVNHGMHGRMLKMSERLLKWCKDRGGFWFDKLKNHHINEGISRYHALINESNMNVRNKIYMPAIKMGVRGVM